MSPKVSVLMTAYNHASFIGQAIESALAQEVVFEYEILIAEDCSTDETRAIVQSYQARFPDRIRLILRPSNLGGRRNFIDAFLSAHGQYVALLEGDDFWTSPRKLQRQAAFLDSHPDYSFCFTGSLKQYEDDVARPIRKLPEPVLHSTYTIDDIIDRNFIRTCSVMYRRALLPAFPDWFYETPVGDWPLHILMARHGPIGCLPEAMAMHRVHGSGVWSPKPVSIRRKGSLKTLTIMRAHLGPQYRRQFDRSIARWQFKILNALRLEKDWAGFLKYLADILARPGAPVTDLVAAVAWSLREARL